MRFNNISLRIYNAVKDEQGNCWFIPKSNNAIYKYDLNDKTAKMVYSFYDLADSGRYNLIVTKSAFFCIDRTRIKIIRIDRESGNRTVFEYNEEPFINVFSILYGNEIFIFPLELCKGVVLFSITEECFWINRIIDEKSIKTNQYCAHKQNVYFLGLNNDIYVFNLKSKEVTKKNIEIIDHVVSIAAFDENSMIVSTENPVKFFQFSFDSKENEEVAVSDSISCCERILKCGDKYFFITDVGIYMFDGKVTHRVLNHDMTSISGSKFLSADKDGERYVIWPFMFDKMVIYDLGKDETNCKYIIDGSEELSFQESSFTLCDYLDLI